MRLSDFRIGKQVEFEYPSHNLLNVPLEYVKRKIVVTAISRLAKHPVDYESIITRPLTRRGSVLIVGRDCSTGEIRSFHFEAIRGTRRLPNYRLGLVRIADPAGGAVMFGPQFEPTAQDWLEMRQVILEYHRQEESDDDGLRLVAFPLGKKRRA